VPAGTTLRIAYVVPGPERRVTVAVVVIVRPMIGGGVDPPAAATREASARPVLPWWVIWA
jgi:hypothetical protein